ncbi:MAG TPA: ferric reductase-like transmembrane domain-containing protein [Solirubrobacteraceae bacterium]|nr:ferric reductase-like transmembrane domain-containing protein [Solirubrobacteraceae bacterium]
MIPVAAVGPSVYWYLTRGTGVVALVLLTVSVVIGIAGTMRVSAVAWPRFAVETVHRDVSLLIIVFLLIHIATSVLDSFAPISLTASVIPFISSYRPLWLGLGTVAFDLIIALAVTSLARRRLGFGTWRAIHWLAYASWPVAVLHGLGTGSDVKATWLLLLTVLCVLAVFGAMALRFARGEGTPPALRIPGVALSVAIPLGIAVFTLAGPLQSGWARRAGTPAKLLAHAAPVASPVSTRVPAASASAASPKVGPFQSQLTGHVTQRQVSGGGLVDINLHLVGPLRGQLRVRLAGSPMPGGGLSMTGSQVDLLIGDRVGSVLAGTISALQGSDFVAHVTGAGAAMTLNVRLDIDQQTGNVSGSLRATT